MGKVGCFTIAGLEMWFYSNDHLPHHFHARKVDEWEIRVAFMLCTPSTLAFDSVWGKQPSSKAKKAILARVLENREQLLAEWEAKVSLD